MKQETRYRIFGTAFGAFALVFKSDGKTMRVIRVLLPPRESSPWDVVQTLFPGAAADDHKDVQKLIVRIQQYFQGKKIIFPLNMLDLLVCKPSQLKVLKVERTIPYGKVASYGWIGKRLGVKGCQPIGTALATNPFPIIIPCHRTIKSTREVGEYQGGEDMKRRMLELEGVRFDLDGKVAKEDFLG